MKRICNNCEHYYECRELDPICINNHSQAMAEDCRDYDEVEEE